MSPQLPPQLGAEGEAQAAPHRAAAASCALGSLGSRRGPAAPRHRTQVRVIRGGLWGCGVGLGVHWNLQAVLQPRLGPSAIFRWE